MALIWTSVNDSLPDDETPVLVTDGVNVTMASYLRWTNQTGWNVASNFASIIYYMPFPPPPPMQGKP